MILRSLAVAIVATLPVTEGDLVKQIADELRAVAIRAGCQPGEGLVVKDSRDAVVSIQIVEKTTTITVRCERP